MNQVIAAAPLIQASGLTKHSPACALSHNPRLLILDEATAGLDPMARDEVLDALRDLVAVEESFPSIPCDRMGIDEYMVLMIKGERYC